MYFITYVSYIIFSAGNQTQGLVHDRQVLHHSLMFPDLGLWQRFSLCNWVSEELKILLFSVHEYLNLSLRQILFH